MQTAKPWIRCLLTIMSVLGMGGATFPAHTAVIVEMYDGAHTGAKTLSQAEGLASEIFAHAGIEVQWSSRFVSDPRALLNDFSAEFGQLCTQPLDSATLRVEILSHAPRGFSPQALGYALPCARSGMHVTIYADRVETVSSATLAMFYRVLGHALAHEIGHALLRSRGHDDTGLMKGVWAKSDWLRAAVSIVSFTPGQSGMMRQQLHRIEAHHTEALPRQENQRRDVVVLASAADKSIDR
jgi:hypothetical protein